MLRVRRLSTSSAAFPSAGLAGQKKLQSWWPSLRRIVPLLFMEVTTRLMGERFLLPDHTPDHSKSQSDMLQKFGKRRIQGRQFGHAFNTVTTLCVVIPLIRSDLPHVTSARLIAQATCGTKTNPCASPPCGSTVNRSSFKL